MHYYKSCIAWVAKSDGLQINETSSNGVERPKNKTLVTNGPCLMLKHTIEFCQDLYRLQSILYCSHHSIFMVVLNGINSKDISSSLKGTQHQFKSSTSLWFISYKLSDKYNFYIDFRC